MTPASTRPAWFMVLSGFGLAGSMLGAVVAALAVASAIVAFGSWPQDPPRVEPAPLTLDRSEGSSRPASRAGALVLPRSDPAPAAGGGAVATGSGSGSPGSAERRSGARSVVGGGSAASLPGAPEIAEIAGRPAQAPPPAAADEPPLAKVGGALDDTTTSLGRSLRTTTSDLGERLGALSPALGVVVAKAGDALATTVQDLGAALAALLGHVDPRPRPR